MSFRYHHHLHLHSLNMTQIVILISLIYCCSDLQHIFPSQEPAEEKDNREEEMFQSEIVRIMVLEKLFLEVHMKELEDEVEELRIEVYRTLLSLYCATSVYSYEGLIQNRKLKRIFVSDSDSDELSVNDSDFESAIDEMEHTEKPSESPAPLHPSITFPLQDPNMNSFSRLSDLVGMRSTTVAPSLPELQWESLVDIWDKSQQARCGTVHQGST